ncbi:MAG: glycosyltransferase [Marinobacter sp.]|jgi:glycosyltransferase involved in cell wall biosynthesis|nr:glycosyltransferase [Marinobacter sp.]
MKNPVLSLVVPFFNAAVFFKDCLVSVRDQMTSDCELILVDDGSSDESVSIVKECFAKELQQGKVLLIQIGNSGPGEARNIGVRAARGQYIGFLDSDDILLPGYFDTVLTAIRTSEPQIVQFHLVLFEGSDETKGEIILSHQSPAGRYTLDEVRYDIFGTGKWFPCTRAYRKKLLLDHPFPSERVFYEDLITLPYLFLELCSIVLLDLPLIAYRSNPAGTTSNHRPEHVATLVNFFKSLSRMRENPATDLLRVQLARSIVFCTLELRLKSIHLADILLQIRNINNKSELIPYLRRVDAVFLRFPRCYLIAEWARQYFLRIKSKNVK